MKLLIVFLLAGMLQVSARGYSQAITVSAKNQPLEQVFKTIERQTGYVFFYDQEALQQAGRVTLDLRRVSLEKALEACFRGQPLGYKIVGKTIVISKSNKKREEAPASPVVKKQPPLLIPIKGTVTNELGQPLANVSVQVRGTTKGTITDTEGKFIIDAEDGDMLDISFVGHQPFAYKVGTNTEPLIQLQANPNSLDEVVIVGLGNKQKKLSVVGALSTVNAKELKQSPVANLSNALAGRLPGLFTVQSSGRPGDGTNIYIRGKATIGGSNSPLIVVDGLERDAGDFGNIDPNEVENITILKDASSTALYGIRGANGVVVVTTRRGRAGRRPEINFTAQYGQQSPIRLPEFLDQYPLALYEEEANPGTYTPDELEAIKSGNFDHNYYAYTNWYDFMLKDKAPQQNYNVNFAGGSEFVRYFVSGSYTNQSSLFDHEDQNIYGFKSNFNRFNFRSNIDISVTKMLDLKVDVAGRLETRTGPYRGYDAIFQDMSRYLPSSLNPTNPDGSFQLGNKIYIADDNHNPYASLIRNGYSNNFWNNMYGTFAVNHKLDFITKGLSAQGQFSFQTNNQRNVGYYQEYDAFRYNADGSLTRSTKRIAGTLTLANNGRPTANRNNYMDLRLNYARKFGNHDVTGQVLGNRSFKLLGDDDGSTKEYIAFATQGVSGRFTYGYDNRYFAEANLAYNGSENFAPGKRYGFFPAFSAGWVLTNEKFIPENNVLTHMKIRGSYGIVGNDQSTDRDGRLYRFVYLSYFDGNPDAGYNEAFVGNPNVTWERSKKMNLGTDITLFKGIVEIVFDVFKERRNNILLRVGTLPEYVGIDINKLSPRNTGEVENKGFEAELKLRKSFGKDFTAWTNFQLTHARNKVLDNDQPTLLAYQSLIGYEIGYDLGYRSLGLFNSWDEVNNSPVYTGSTSAPGDIKYLDVNKDGVVDASDRVPLQFENFPRYVLGASAGISYKGIDISVLFNGTKGGTVNMTPVNRDYFLKGRKIWEDRWTPENTDAQMPRALRQASWNQIKSDFWTQSSDYLKLRNAEIGYELPKSLIKKAGMQYARVFVNGQNLYTWDKLWIKEGDPETVGNITYYPLQKVINVGVNIRF